VDFGRLAAEVVGWRSFGVIRNDSGAARP
jgi:hypothetical protein